MSLAILQFCSLSFSVLFTSSLIYTLIYNKSSNLYGDILYEFPFKKINVLILIILFSFISFIFINSFFNVKLSLTIFLLCWFLIASFMLCFDKSTERLVITTTGIGYKTLITGLQKDDFIDWSSIETWNFEENEHDVLHLKLPDDCNMPDKYLLIPKNEQIILTSLFNIFCH